jgi:hypothetical protein
VVHHDDDPYYDDPYYPPNQGAVYTTIDADHVLDTDLGLGAGMFVEYGVGGRWTLWTSCDTDITGALCNWEAHVSARSGAITDVRELDNESYDYAEYRGDHSLSFYAETGSYSDAVEFYTDPGVLLDVEVVLDGFVAPEYLVWFGNGYVHDGASGSPVVFQPDQP